jgi:hypothetical protein
MECPRSPLERIVSPQRRIEADVAAVAIAMRMVSAAITALRKLLATQIGVTIDALECQSVGC